MKLSLNWIPIALVFLIIPRPAITENQMNASDSLPTYWLNEIVVLEDRLPVVGNATMHQINADQIAHLDARDPASAMHYVPGLQVSRISKGESMVKIRGFDQRQISVFLDGIPISVPYNGRIDLAQLVNNNIDKIRITKGTGSALYGTNTLGGSINIITESFADRPAFNIKLEGSDHGRYFSSVNYHNQWDNLDYEINLHWDKADDFKLSDSFKPTVHEDGDRRDNSAYDKKNFGFNLRYRFNPHHVIGINYHHVDNEYHIPVDSKTERPRYWRFPEWRKNVVSLNSRNVFHERFMLRSVFYYDSYYNLLKSYDDATYTTQTQRYAWQSSYDDHSIGGILYPSLDIFKTGSTNGVLSFKQDVHREEFRDFGFDRYAMNTWTIGVEQDFRITSKISAVIGMDVNHLQPTTAAGIDLRDPISLWNTQAALQFTPNASWTFHLSSGKKSRFPTLKELYSERLGRTIPNNKLQEEQALNNEAGMRLQWSDGYLQLAGFYNQMQDLIEIREVGDETNQLKNIGKARISGFELDSKFVITNAQVLFNYTWMDARNRSDMRDSDYLAYRPEQMINTTWVQPIHNRLTAHLEGQYIGNQYYQNPGTLQWQKLDNYTLLNFKLNYRISPNLNWFVRLNNALDENYESEYSVPMPGREIAGGIRFNMW
ncbi:MAG: TonB-dependent receptor [Caldithrix sp.]|nr:TonB-dependent receptor [Caldithrix sp.]